LEPKNSDHDPNLNQKLKEEFIKRKLGYCLSAVAVLMVLLAACSSAAEPQAITETVVVKEEATVKEAVHVEATEMVKVEEVASAAPAAEQTEGEDAYTTIYGERLPEDAAPYDMQIYSVACDITGNQTTFDFQVSVYQRFCGDEGKLNDLFQDQLVTLDKDFNVIPASAESWKVSEDGLTWTFHLKPGLQWSDGTPLTAYDWEATYQLMANPEHAWDFAWFYAGVLQNWDEIIMGELLPSKLGVKARDDLTLEFTTQEPWPALPAMMEFSFVLQKKALEEYGPLYNSNVETSVSAGPFMLDVLEPGNRIELVPNPMYKGYRQPFLKRVIGEYRDMSTAFVAFQNREIDYVNYQWLIPDDFEIVQSDPELKANYLRHYGDFRTDYLLFDTYNPPFDDLNVRKAFAYAVDREAIVENIYDEIKAMPAHSFLMPGFPASDTEGKLKEYQTYDCDQAKDYLAKAGYPDGHRFPQLEMWLRNEQEAVQAVFQGVAASIQDCLNVTIEVSNQDQKSYLDALNAKPTQLQFGAASYGMDFLDPSNMLGIWFSTGRHSWKNDEFDAFIREASSKTDDLAKRTEMFQEAEQILVDDVGGIFIAHRWQGDLLQPYVQGVGFREPDAQGIAAWHWGNDGNWGDIYISKDVVNYDTFRTQ
jgi:peptide/nickel transport system substrate-binding protein/oligopeptide transport system substrate-binding protein